MSDPVKHPTPVVPIKPVPEPKPVAPITPPKVEFSSQTIGNTPLGEKPKVEEPKTLKGKVIGQKWVDGKLVPEYESDVVRNSDAQGLTWEQMQKQNKPKEVVKK